MNVTSNIYSLMRIPGVSAAIDTDACDTFLYEVRSAALYKLRELVDCFYKSLASEQSYMREIIASIYDHPALQGDISRFSEFTKVREILLRPEPEVEIDDYDDYQDRLSDFKNYA